MLLLSVVLPLFFVFFFFRFFSSSKPPPDILTLFISLGGEREMCALPPPKRGGEKVSSKKTFLRTQLKISFSLFPKSLSKSFIFGRALLYCDERDGTTNTTTKKRRTEVRLVLRNDGEVETSFSSDDIRGLLLGNSECLRRVLSNARVVGPIAKVRDQTRGRREWRVRKKTW